MLSDGSFTELTKKISSVEKSAYDVIKRLSALEADMAARQAEEKEQESAAPQPEEVAEKQPEPAVEKAEPVESKTAEVKPEEKPEEKTEVASAPEKAEAKPEVKAEQASRQVRPEAPATAKAVKEKTKEVKESEKKEEAKAQPAQPKRPSFIVAKASSLPPKTFVNSDANGRTGGRNNSSQTRGNGQRPASQPRYVAPAAPQPVKPSGKNFGPDKKKGFEKTYVEKDRHAISKRALAKQQGVTVEDFDEDKSGYRKLRVKKDKKQVAVSTVKIEHAVVTTDEIPLKVLSEKIGMSAVAITKWLFKEGIMKTVNESIDYDTAALLAASMGIELEYKPEKTAEEILSEKQADTVEEIESLVPRAPVVTVTSW